MSPPLTKLVKNPETGEIERVPLTPEEAAAFLAPQPEPVPQVITKRQRNLWLGQSRYQAIRTWIAQLPEEQKFDANIHFNDADTTERHHPLTLAMAARVGLNTSEQIDQAFREAAKL